MGAMLVYPRQDADSVARALSDFAQGVLPGLLPFSACALLLTAGRTLPVGLLTALALPGGSPTGARLFQDAGLSAGAARRAAASDRRADGLHRLCHPAAKRRILAEKRADAGRAYKNCHFARPACVFGVRGAGTIAKAVI